MTKSRRSRRSTRETESSTLHQHQIFYARCLLIVEPLWRREFSLWKAVDACTVMLSSLLKLLWRTDLHLSISWIRTTRGEPFLNGGYSSVNNQSRLSFLLETRLLRKQPELSSSLSSMAYCIVTTTHRPKLFSSESNAVTVIEFPICRKHGVTYMEIVSGNHNGILVFYSNIS